MIVNDQLLKVDSIIVSRVITDVPAWITIHLKAGGKSGELSRKPLAVRGWAWLHWGRCRRELT